MRFPADGPPIAAAAPAASVVVGLMVVLVVVVVVAIDVAATNEPTGDKAASAGSLKAFSAVG